MKKNPKEMPHTGFFFQKMNSQDIKIKGILESITDYLLLSFKIHILLASYKHLPA